ERRHFIDGLKGEVKLGVTEVGIPRAKARGGPGLLKILAGEEVAVTNFELEAARDRQAGNGREFGAEETAVSGIDAVANTRSWGETASRRAGYGVEIIVGIGEPQGIADQGYAQAGNGLEGEVDSRVLNILERNQIHGAIEFVVGREEVFESFVSVVGRVAVARAVIELESKPGSSPDVRESITGLDDDHEGALIETRGDSTGSEARIDIIAE